MSTVLVFYNQLLDPILATGGDVRCAETIKRWRGLKTEVVGPPIAQFLKEELKPRCFHSLGDSFFERQYQKSKSVFLIGPLYIWRTLIAVLKLKNHRPDVVYTTGDFICNTLPAFFIKRKNPQTKWVANIFHLNPPPAKRTQNKFLYSLGSFLLQRASFFFLKQADLILLLNNDVKKSLIEIGFDPQKLAVLGAGVDLQRIKKIKSEKPRRNEVIFLGRLNLTKGIFDLPKIWPKVLKKVPQAKLLLIGAGEEKMVQRLKGKFEKAGVSDSVIFTGFIKESEAVYKLLKQGKVFVLPSYEEGWGIVVFEAIACGLAPVVYNLPIFKENFGNDIQTVPLGKTSLFSSAIVKLLSDENFRQNYVFRLKEKIKKYDWSELAKKELELIKNEHYTGN